ncbi:MAG: hypothetical protein JWL73_2303 [Actinomycetia bacterium]|nr:hypothetical protein [Actinomycetes bacterium]
MSRRRGAVVGGEAQGRLRALTFDDATIDRLLSGNLVEDDTPSQFLALAEIFETANGPPLRSEFAGERKVAAVHSLAQERRRRSAREVAAHVHRISARIAVAVVVGCFGATGVAAAATGSLPPGAQATVSRSVAAVGISVPAPAPSPTPPPPIAAANRAQNGATGKPAGETPPAVTPPTTAAPVTTAGGPEVASRPTATTAPDESSSQPAKSPSTSAPETTTTEPPTTTTTTPTTTTEPPTTTTEPPTVTPPTASAPPVTVPLLGVVVGTVRSMSAATTDSIAPTDLSNTDPSGAGSGDNSVSDGGSGSGSGGASGPGPSAS